MLLFSLLLLAIAALFVAVPVMISARIVGAGRTGFLSCLLAAIVSFIIVAIAVRMFHGGGLLSFFVAPLGYMLILDTSYLRGLCMVVLQYVMAVLLVIALLFTALGSMLHVKDTLHGMPGLDDTPAQSI